MAIWRTQVQYTYGTPGSPGFSTFHAEDVEDPATLNDLNAVSGLLEGWYTQMGPYVPQDVTISHDGVWTGVGPNVGLRYEGDTWTLAGANSSIRLPDFVCPLIGWRTTTTSPPVRGRTFLFPVAANACSQLGRPAGAFTSDVEGATDALVAASVAITTGGLRIWSGKNQTAHEIVSGELAGEFAYLSTRRD